jgi:hypothetical protein
VTSPTCDREIVCELVSSLGPTLVASLSGSKDRTLPLRWAEDGGPEPTSDAARRLTIAHQQWTRLASVNGAELTRLWFISGNLLLCGDTPLTAIREDRHLDVAQAAEAFID